MIDHDLITIPDLVTLENYEVADGPIVLESIKILNGANYFSGGPIIRFRINLGEFDEVFSNQIEGLFEHLQSQVPSLYEHQCSVGEPGGFFLRVKEGTLLGHVMEHLTLELEHLAGMNVSFGKTRITKAKGVYNVVFRFIDEKAGIYAGKAALNFLNSFLLKASFDIQEIIKNLIYIREKRLLGPSTQAIVDEAKERKIPVLRIDKYNMVQLGAGKYKKLIQATVTDNTSLIAVEIVANKFRTTEILKEAGVPVPETICTGNLQEAITFIEKLKKTVVIKPAFGNRGKGVSIGLKTPENIQKAFQWALSFDKEAIVQEDIEGATYRMLVIDFKFVAAVRMFPPSIKGTGIHSIQELVAQLNADPAREIGDKGKLTCVRLDDNTLKILELIGYEPTSIPRKNEIIYLKNSGNFHLGASSVDFTDEVHPFNRFIVERACKVVNLNSAGVDIISKNITVPLTLNNGKIIELNAAPDFKMHLLPTIGQKRQVQKPFVDMLFKDGTPSTIPVYSVTGSKGKSICVQIIQQCMKSKGYRNGVVSRFGLFIHEHALIQGDATDSKNVAIVMKDPTIDCVILETTVEAILESGLGYEHSDFGIVLNVIDNKAEYYGYDHIRDVNDVAYAKSVVAEMVYDHGYSVLNADDDLVYEMIERLYSKLALFSKNKNNSRIKSLLDNGGIAAIMDENDIKICTEKERNILINLTDIPFINDNTKTDVYDAVLAAALTLYLSGIKFDEIRETLQKINLK